MNPLVKTLLLVKELGPAQLAENTLYRFQMRSGWLEKMTPARDNTPAPVIADFIAEPLINFKWIDSKVKAQTYLLKANEIAAGKFRPFGSSLEKLDLTIPQPLQHWTRYNDNFTGKDIKLFWEPARFAWVLPLCAAYAFSGDEKYPAVFWKYFESFVQHNPVNLGPNWSSAQEVALRLIFWTIAGQAFVHSKESTPQRMQSLSDAIWQHCRRIPPTLHYAKSQHNNHLLSETLGLVIGGRLFERTAEGQAWITLGTREFEKGILDLVAEDGTFSQHSTNYHRMLLHLALLFNRVCEHNKCSIPRQVLDRLALATKWLIGQYDPLSGCAANLGHNDGTDLLPIGAEDYCDYRPVLQAASRAFLCANLLPPGHWDELSATLDLNTKVAKQIDIESISSPAIHRIGNIETWASLRACQFDGRPAHADQLHVEIWHQGTNVALDAGTFAYNLPAPWQNALAGTSVHNTVTIAGQDQMFKASKFLWLRHVNADILSASMDEITASVQVRSGQGYRHTRQLRFIDSNHLEVIDTIVCAGKSEPPVAVQWLLPDWNWSIDGETLSLRDGRKSVRLEISAVTGSGMPINGATSLIRGGETLHGIDDDPIRGWVSPTYLVKLPALSLSVQFSTSESLTIKSLWSLNNKVR